MSESIEIPTLPRIRAALAAHGGHPSRRFGQNFLTDQAILRQIVADAEVAAGDVVLEVGPGPGTLTAALLERGAHVVAVEVDQAMRRLLDQLVRSDRLTVVEGDVLAERPRLPQAVRERLEERGRESGRDGFLLVANLPYQVAATLLVDLFTFDPPRRAVVTVQREVADRLRAAPGDDAYGGLSVAMQLRAGVAMTRRLAPGSFWPAPKVSSACVRLDPRPAAGVEQVPPEHLRRVIQATFHARRKRVLNSLADALGDTHDRVAIEESLARAGVSPARRGEELSPAEVLQLALQLSVTTN